MMSAEKLQRFYMLHKARKNRQTTVPVW